MKKLSIITINYNNLNGLIKTVESVTNQTYQDFEYIVIDGDSTDGSLAYIESRAALLNYYISEKDTGIYNAMNKGIKVATGEYLLFLNSGDSLANSIVLEKVMPHLECNKSFVYGNMMLSKNNQIISKLTPPSSLNFAYFVTNSLPHPATFIKRQLFATYLMYNENLKIVADWEFFIFCICKQDESYQYIDQTISDFDNDGISNQIESKLKIIAEENQVFYKYFAMFLIDVEWIRNIKTKRLQQLNFLSTKALRWKLLKGLCNMLIGQKKINYTKPFFTKL